MSSEHLSLTLINVGTDSRAMKDNGKIIPHSRHPDQPTVQERFVQNSYHRVTFVIEADSFRTDLISNFARRFCRVIGFCEDVLGHEVMVQKHPDNIETIVLVSYSCQKGNTSRGLFGESVLVLLFGAKKPSVTVILLHNLTRACRRLALTK